eukprot:TRINITY_DN3366_c0_g1_i1.p1 TRINITY_DN3366_c0_g1~~TRINITY_DN3366_c0_g1_i1.p1  ORF type:complete len:610 (+),score=63.03 TRINITY_DN3366_c0_g1_i1:36-1865(+)
MINFFFWFIIVTSVHCIQYNRTLESCFKSGEVTPVTLERYGRITASFRKHFSDQDLFLSIGLHNKGLDLDLRVYNNTFELYGDLKLVQRNNSLSWSPTKFNKIVFERKPQTAAVILNKQVLVNTTMSSILFLDSFFAPSMSVKFAVALNISAEHAGFVEIDWVEYEVYDINTETFVFAWRDDFNYFNKSLWSLSDRREAEVNLVYDKRNVNFNGSLFILLAKDFQSTNESEEKPAPWLIAIIVVCIAIGVSVGIILIVFVIFRHSKLSERTNKRQSKGLDDVSSGNSKSPPGTSAKSIKKRITLTIPGSGPLTDSEVLKAGYTYTISGSQKDDVIDTTKIRQKAMAHPEELLSLREWQCTEEEVTTKEFLGEGCEGLVYRAVYKGNVVALKRMRKKDASSKEITDFCREVNFMYRMKKHENVVSFIAACLDPMFILMELVIGKQLYCIHNKTLNIKGRKLDILRQIASGMRHIHLHKLVHNDLWTKNVIITEKGVVKILDFGLSRMMDTETRTRGHKNYWDPFSGPEVSFTRDIFSFGVIVWEILLEIRPEKNPHESGYLALDDLDHLPELRDLIKGCCNSDVFKRPASFTDICKTLSVVEKNKMYKTL